MPMEAPGPLNDVTKPTVRSAAWPPVATKIVVPRTVAAASAVVRMIEFTGFSWGKGDPSTSGPRAKWDGRRLACGSGARLIAAHAEFRKDRATVRADRSEERRVGEQRK